MNDWKDQSFSRLPVGQRRQAANSLKGCPLCGTLNSKQNAECVTCRWRGEFEDDPFVIEEGLQEMLDQCPELVEAILIPPRRRLSPWRGFLWIWSNLARFFTRPMRRTARNRLDFRA